MEAGRVGDETDPRPRHVPGHSERLLTVAGLYGANASGKSNVLAALAFMREAVVMSHRFWSPDEGESDLNRLCHAIRLPGDRRRRTFAV